MRTLFFLFLILLVAVGLGFLIHQDPGYIVIAYQQWTIATSIWIGLVIVLIAFLVLYFVVRLFKNIVSIPRLLARRRQFLNLQGYQKYMTQGVLALAIGDFKKAEKYFVKVIGKNNSYANYLLAAQAAQGQKAFDRRDNYLKTAFQLAKDNTFAVSLVQGLYCLHSDQWDEALVSLKVAYKEEPKNTMLLNALKMIYFKKRDWQSMQLILSQLKKQKLISKDELSVISNPM